MINKYGMDMSEELKEKRYLRENTIRKRKYFKSQRKCDRNVERVKQSVISIEPVY